MADTQNVYQRLSAVQNELKVPKGQKNTFGGYSYRSAEDILEAVKPVLAKHGLMLFISDSLEHIGERHYVKATIRLFMTERALGLAISQEIEVTAYAREEETKKGMDGSQITGAASSYARKYALNGLFNIDDTKDADTDAHHKVTHQEQSSHPASSGSMGSSIRVPSEKQLQLIKDLSNKLDIDPAIRDQRIDLLETSAQASEAIEKLQAALDKKGEE